jgi:hypothetical protein
MGKPIGIIHHEPPLTSWWCVAPAQGFLAYVLREQWPRMRGTMAANFLTGSESGACVSQWHRRKLTGTTEMFEE